MRRRSLVSALSVLLTAAAPIAAARPSPTPTPRPKLSGGFGRPRATATPGDPTSSGQSLADVVRAAHDGKPGDKPADRGVVIDNHSLVTDPNKGRVSTSRIVRSPTPSKTAAKVPDAPAPAGGAAAAAAPTAPGMQAGDAAPTEAEWHGIAVAARQRVTDAKAKVAELEATNKKLENDFYAWDDGQYRDRVIKPSWDRARQDLDQAKAELAAAEKDLADLPERARRAGALPGWIRE